MFTLAQILEFIGLLNCIMLLLFLRRCRSAHKWLIRGCIALLIVVGAVYAVQQEIAELNDAQQRIDKPNKEADTRNQLTPEQREQFQRAIGK